MSKGQREARERREPRGPKEHRRGHRASRECKGRQGRKAIPTQGPPSLNPLRLALKRWHPVNNVAAFTVGGDPRALAFDGSSMWIAGGNGVGKIRASDGLSLGSYSTGSGANAVLFDGASIWVANATDGTVSKLRASDGQSLGTYPVATNLRALAFDGTNVWALSGLYGEDITLSKVRATDGSVVAKYSYEPLAGQAQDLLFDGTYIWVLLLNPSQGSLMKIVPSDGNVVATRTVGQSDRFLFNGCWHLDFEFRSTIPVPSPRSRSATWRPRCWCRVLCDVDDG